jgi:hypothetical protein
MATRASTMAHEPTPGGEGGVTPRPRIDPLTRLLVLRLKRAEPDRSSASIAQAIGGISEASVRRLCEGWTTDIKQLTQELMQLTVADRLANWERACDVAAEKGYHQPSKDYLEAAQLVEPKAAVQANVNVTPTVHLHMPFALGAVPQPTTTIEAQAVPVLPAKEEA